MRLSDLMSGLVFAVGGVAIILAAMSYPAPRSGGVGPQLFPIVIGLVLVAAGLTIAVRDFIRTSRTPLLVIPEGLRSPAGALALLAVPAGIASFALLAPRIGTIAASVLVVFVAAVGWREHPLKAAILALVASFVVYWFFAFGLRVPLPSALVEGLLR